MITKQRVYRIRKFLLDYRRSHFQRENYCYIIWAWSEYIKFPLICIIIACLIYLIHPPDSHIVLTCLRIVNLDSLYDSELIFNPILKVIRFYMPDLLWALALLYVLIHLWKPSNFRSNLLLIVIYWYFTFLLEFAQKSKLIHGTFDFLDVLIYLTLGSVYLISQKSIQLMRILNKENT